MTAVVRHGAGQVNTRPAVLRVLRVLLRETGWLLAAPFRFLFHWPRTCLTSLFVAAGLIVFGHALVLLAPAVIVALLVLWHRAGPFSFEQAIATPFRRARRVHRVRRRWPLIMARAGLSEMRKVPQVFWDKTPPKDETLSPRPRAVRWEAGQLVADVVPLVGQTTAQLQAVSEAIRQGLGAALAQVLAVGTTGVQLRLTFGDPLAEPFGVQVFDSCDLNALPMGRTETGAGWYLRLGPQTLVAGRSGSGKASLVWGLIFGVAPAIRDGLVEVHGVDLKGGMELSMGERLLTRYARTGPEAVVLLEDAAQGLQGRARRLAGTTRQHVASTWEPHVVVLIDELAALTAYLGDRDLTRRANTALAILCSQGRAVGYTVFACLQDPRKETIPSRGLFTQMIGLRLADREETAMVLGDGAANAGAACHRIPATTPGVGYLIPETGGPPVRVRGALISDDDIRHTAVSYPAPRRRPVILAASPIDGSSASSPPRPRRTRKTAGASGADAGEAA